MAYSFAQDILLQVSDVQNNPEGVISIRFIAAPGFIDRASPDTCQLFRRFCDQSHGRIFNEGIWIIADPNGAAVASWNLGYFQEMIIRKAFGCPWLH